MRIGMGYDVHPLVSGRKLVLGGVTVPFEKGLLGHSDADVLVHAICDSLLGAAGLGDIGQHFPDSDGCFKDIFSIILLEKSCQLVKAAGYTVVNIDATVMAQAPRLAPFKGDMEDVIASAMALNPQFVNIKATTTEGLGIFGRGEAMGAMCIALIE